MKINHPIEEENTLNELKALKILKPKYVIGTFHKDEGYFQMKEILPLSKIVLTNNQKKIIDQLQWYDEKLKYVSSERTSCSLILMKQCKNIENLVISDKDQVLKMYIDLVPLLEYAHSLNIVHCDLRLNNIMSLDDEYVLIDWDLSSFVGKKQFLSDGSRYSNRPNNLCLESKCKNPYDNHVVWTPAHDFEMLNELIFRLYVNICFLFFISLILILFISSV